LLFGQKKLRFYASGGLTPAFILFERIVAETVTNGTITGDPNYINSPFNLFAEVELGVNVVTGKRMEIQAGPYYSTALRDTSSQVVTSKLWSCGLSIACYFKL
jgi:hypothetical protein